MQFGDKCLVTTYWIIVFDSKTVFFEVFTFISMQKSDNFDLSEIFGKTTEPRITKLQRYRIVYFQNSNHPKGRPN